MTHKEFCDWLKGFFDGLLANGGLEYNEGIIQKKLQEVKEPGVFINSPTIMPFIPPVDGLIISDGIINPQVQTAELSWNTPAFT